MEYLDQYKNFVSTIKDPLERLDDIEVFIEEYEWRSDRIEESHAIGQTSIKEYKSHIKESTVLFYLILKIFNIKLETFWTKGGDIDFGLTICNQISNNFSRHWCAN